MYDPSATANKVPLTMALAIQAGPLVTFRSSQSHVCPQPFKTLMKFFYRLWLIYSGLYRADLPYPWSDLFYRCCPPLYLSRPTRSVMHILTPPDVLVHHRLVLMLAVEMAFVLLHPPLPLFMPPDLQPAQTCLSRSSCHHLCCSSAPESHL